MQELIHSRELGFQDHRIRVDHHLADIRSAAGIGVGVSGLMPTLLADQKSPKTCASSTDLTPFVLPRPVLARL
jgi:hypothetical protein